MGQHTLSLADALGAVSRPHVGVRCMTCMTIETMNEEDRQVFEAAIASGNYSIPMIVDAMRSAGYKSSRGSLARHKRGECMPR